MKRLKYRFCRPLAYVFKQQMGTRKRKKGDRMNDDQVKTLDTHLKSIAQSLETIAKFVAQKEQRAATKAAAKAQKRASLQAKK